MKTAFSILVGLIIFIIGSCSNPAMQHVTSKYPDCKVQKLKSTSRETRVLIVCPHQEPFEKVYRSNK
jgi:hypothetical protein